MIDRGALFNEHRSRLYGIAYRMLGSRADAEDMVQEAYLRWHRADVERIQVPQAWLVTAITRLCIDRLRAARTEREAYVGPWLPEPITGSGIAPPADAQSELASDLSVAFLVVLERLAPEERAAFLLHEVFDSGVCRHRRDTGQERRRLAARSFIAPASACTRTGRASRSAKAHEAACSSDSWRRCGPKTRPLSCRCSRPTPPGPPMAAARPRRRARSFGAPSSWRGSRAASGAAMRGT